MKLEYSSSVDSYIQIRVEPYNATLLEHSVLAGETYESLIVEPKLAPNRRLSIEGNLYLQVRADSNSEWQIRVIDNPQR